MIRFGIIGAGRIARKFAADIRTSKEAKLVAIASRSKKRAETFQHEFDLPYRFDNYDDLFASEEVDAIYIATPHNYHKEQSIRAMQHNKHVLCEKPIAVNAQEFEEMTAIAKKHNVLLMEAMWTAFLPVYRTLNQMKNSGILGSLLSADLRFGDELVSSITASGRLLNPELAGGSILDIGVYPISVVQLFIDESTHSIQSSALLSKTNVDLYAVIEVTLDNQQTTKVHLESAIDRVLSNEATLQFTNGTLVIPQFFQANTFYWNDELIEYSHRSGGFEYQIDAFCTTIQQHLLENSIRPHSASMRSLQWMDEIRSQIGVKYPFE